MIDFSITHLLVACLGLGLGISLSSYYYRKRESSHSEARRNLEHENELLKSSLELSRRQEQLMEDFSNKLAVSSQSLIKEMKEETKSYFSEKSKTIESILTPVQATLTAFKQNLETFETKHAEDRGSLKEQISQLLAAEKKLEKEAQALTDILKHPGSRGRWGEIQLERILELSGMLKYCDYETQATDNEGSVRADMVIRLPHERCLIIDSKAPFSETYLSGDTSDKSDLVGKIKDHIKTLKSKSYWEKFHYSPEFVILFLPGESIFNDALRIAPELIDIAATSNVILSGPLTLLALLKTVAHTWKQENLRAQIQEIGQLGKELHHRLHVVFNYFHKIGKNLNNTVQSYNDMSSSLQHRILPTLRKFEDLEITSSLHRVEDPSPIHNPAISFLPGCEEDDIASEDRLFQEDKL
ncbi:DNA recombination protein RmuC [Chlamydia psittaci]|uniref:DNA recombination protein RmuC n=1 Tax=Chlamydia psittaci TaxID=83554 RepID=UPI00027E1AB8|nr:DNA recombination protein RmuC [Chlamydia psittaci]AFS21673.1 rmuC family protein [Chlamydia psittaci MN]KPZ38846.1 DNA recombination protein RmuC [Chlamydia psittaci str. Frances]MBE3635755.1 DNA recombination protein RmuC [Chlamydia psittaci]CCO02266.1 putative DNA recombination protein [Chlamydia psittaci 01DC12]BEU44444.1 DNA recombination protein RmuC [Chlamydia psittaci]